MKAITRTSLALLLAAAMHAGQDARGQAKKAGTLIIQLRTDAALKIDDKVVGATGKSERTYTTPPLGPGKSHAFVVKASWAPNGWTTITRTRKATVKAGETTTVDLRKADPRQPDELFIRYVTTPTPVVEAMLKMARVGKDDVVFDLGCGDGRIVVTAVAKFGAKRGVGVDIDPARIRDSQATVKAAGVGDKVELRQADVLKVKDLDKATVVCLYLGEELNEQLRPLLQKVLRPGTRVVSHRFPIGNWEPDETQTIRVGATDRKLYLWTVKKKGEKKAGREGK